MLVCLLLGVVVSPAFAQQSDDKKDWDGSWKFSYRLSKSDKEVKAAIRFMREDDKLVAQYRDSEKTKAKVEVNADGNEVELKLIYDAEWIAPTTLKGKLEKDRSLFLLRLLLPVSRGDNTRKETKQSAANTAHFCKSAQSNVSSCWYSNRIGNRY